MLTDALFSELIRKGGGSLANFASSIGVRPQTVHHWRLRGTIPARHCKVIEGRTGVSVRRLRPKDWRVYWPAERRGA